MITKTHFHMLREFKMKPKHFGVLNSDEVKQIRDHFQIEERSNVDLQNLRDFVALHYGRLTNNDMTDMEKYDLISGIIGVIDDEKWNRGLEA